MSMTCFGLCFPVVDFFSQIYLLASHPVVSIGNLFTQLREERIPFLPQPQQSATAAATIMLRMLLVGGNCQQACRGNLKRKAKLKCDGVGQYFDFLLN